MLDMPSAARQRWRFLMTCGVLGTALAACGGGGGSGGGLPVLGAAGPGASTPGTSTPAGGGQDEPAAPALSGPYTVEANYTQGTVLEYATSDDSGPGLLRIELGAPKKIADKTLFALEATQWDAKEGTRPRTLRWKFLGSADGAILGSADGQSAQVIYGAGGTQVAGMFEDFGERKPSLNAGKVDGVYNHLTAVVAASDASEGGCHTTAGVQVCDDFSASVNIAEFYKSGIGPIASRYRSSYLSTGGGIGSAGATTRSVELVRSTLSPADGEPLPDFRSTTAADLPEGYRDAALAAHGSKLYAFASDPSFVSDEDTVRVSVYDPAENKWTEESRVARLSVPLGLTPGSSWRAHSVGEDLIALVRDRQNLFWYQPSTHQWRKADEIALSPDDHDTISTADPADAPSSAAWTDSAGQGHLLIASFAKRREGDFVARLATIYDSQTRAALGSISLGATPSPQIAVIGSRLYAKKGPRGVLSCSLPALNDCVEQGSVLPDGVFRSRWAVLGSKIYEIGGEDSGPADSDRTYPSQRSVQVFDTAALGNPGTVLPPVASGTGTQLAPLDGKLYMGSGTAGHVGVEVYTP